MVDNSVRVSPEAKPSPSTIRRNRIYFVLGAILVLSIGGLYARETARALYVRSLHGSVFANYVIKHHIGTSAVSDDASGFQTDFSVLTLGHAVAAKDALRFSEQMARQYYNLDGGTMLTIQYRDPATHKTVTQASTVYNQGTHTLAVTLRQGGSVKSVSEKVDWLNENGS